MSRSTPKNAARPRSRPDNTATTSGPHPVSESSGPALYRAEPLHEKNLLHDILLTMPDGKTRHLCGRSGPLTEERPVRAFLDNPQGLPVLLGLGMGRGLDALLNESDLPVAVLDREEAIARLTGTAEKYRSNPRVTWIYADSPKDALVQLTKWQMEHAGQPLVPLAHPVYLRLDPDFYNALRDSLNASQNFDFWGKARYAKFAAWPPRILLLTSQYFLMGELKAACERLDIPHYFLDVGANEIGRNEFVEELLQSVLTFRPDFVLTVNHLGVDREGILAGLLEKMKLPLASWFVDNPHLILSMYRKLVNPWTALFTWDRDNLPSLRDMGFEHAHYLPLAADVQRFRPAPAKDVPASWQAPVSFVGNSMVSKVRLRLKTAAPPPSLIKSYPEIARRFGTADYLNTEDFLHAEYPHLLPDYELLDTPERKLAYNALVTWESTRQYRKDCVQAILPLHPLIVGDPGWKETFSHEGIMWRWHKELGYYNELPRFYPCSQVNFNCTSLQMKGAVNQRVFDVPACDAFVLTDHRDQIEDLFEPGKEVAVYRNPGEAAAMARHYLGHPAERRAIARAARMRILKEHTYDHRMEYLMQTMRKIFK